MINRPSYKSGFAKSAGESRFPGLWRGLVGAWLPALGQVELLRNIGGGKYDASLVGSPAWVFSRLGGAFQLVDASNQYIDCGIISEINGISHMSVGMWFKKDALAKTVAAGNVTAVDANRGWFINVHSSGVLNMRVDLGGSYITYTWDSAEWTYVVLVYDGTQATDLTKLKMFINGLQVPATVGTAGVDTVTPTSEVSSRFGMLGAYALQSDGQIAMGQIWNRTLSPNEINLLYKRPLGMLEKDRPIIATSIAPVITGPPVGSLSMMGVGR